MDKIIDKIIQIEDLLREIKEIIQENTWANPNKIRKIEKEIFKDGESIRKYVQH